MNPLELQLDYPFGDTLPEAGGTVEVAPGVRWLRMPLPFALDHINLWLLEDGSSARPGWTIVDCGISNDATKANWERVFDGELQGRPVTRVLVTHMHPDHIGLSYWLTERWRAPLWISMADYALARVLSLGVSGSGGEQAAAHFERHGLTDTASVAKIRARATYYPGLVPRVPDSFARIMGGDTISIGAHDWIAIAGYGHAPEHMSLYCASLGVMIAGDMMLPRISTNVSVFDLEPEGNPLPRFLDSIERFRQLPADTLVLPSHGKPFRGLHTRIDQLKAHHDERLAEVMDACREGPQSAAQIVPVMFKRALDLHQMTFAMGESLAHLHMLWRSGDLRREVGADGKVVFEAA